MASVTEICNQALIALGAEIITSLDDPDSQNALMCKAFFETDRRALLRQHPWNFAVASRVELAKTTNTPVYRYDYEYQLPTDCLRVLTVYYDTDNRSRDYKVEGDKVLTNDNYCYLKYIADIPNTVEWDSIFTQVMVNKIRYSLAYSVTRSSSQASTSYQVYMQSLEQAMAIDSTEDIEDQLMTSNTFLGVRY